MIGITERGDASLDYSWVPKCRNREVRGAILITKNITNRFIEEVAKLRETGFPIVVHCTCTGWGRTWLEPKVPEPEEQLSQFTKLLNMKILQKDCAVLRVDPIIPTKEGIERAVAVITHKLPIKVRYRISILDEYKHVKDRLQTPFYDNDRMFANWSETHAVMASLWELPYLYEVCAEPYLNTEGHFIQQGCLSSADLKYMGLQELPPEPHRQQRKQCLCHWEKTELLNNCHRCPHGCLYCYWYD